jgi:hypothetical protein
MAKQTGSSDALTGTLMSGLTGGLKGMAASWGKHMVSRATDKVGDTAKRLTDFAEGGGGGGGGSKGKSLKVTNIVERIDVGVPVRLAYDQWTRFTDFPTFMKKVESVEQDGDEKLHWKAQVLWSHRSWTSTIIEQVPDRRIVWQSEGEKGSVDGAVTFHELGPELTRIQLILQYHPQGFFERTGNLWRAQGRRARLELKHFARHVTTESVLHPDEVEGWRGEIHDGQVVQDQDEDRDQDEDQDQDQYQDQDQDQDGRGRGRKEQEQDRSRSRERPNRRPNGQRRPARATADR